MDTQKYSPHINDAQSFIPERWADLEGNKNVNYTYLPFGVGPRGCIGKPFAYMFLKLFTAFLVTECDWTLENPKPNILRFPVRHPQDLLPMKLWGREKAGAVHTPGVGKMNGNGNLGGGLTTKKEDWIWSWWKLRLGSRTFLILCNLW